MKRKLKIIYDREECIGAAACVAVAPEYWELDNDGKANLIKDNPKLNEETKKWELVIEVDEKTFNSIKESADVCPVLCIEIFEITEDGNENKIAPE